MKRLVCAALACFMLAAAFSPATSADGGLILKEDSHLVLGDVYVEKIDGTVTADGLRAEFAGDVDVAGKDGTAAVATDDTVSCGADSLRALIYGDVNRDGKISVTDVTAMLKKIAAWDVDVNTDAADVDANGKLTVSDVTKMLKYLARWDDISLGNVRMVFENVRVTAEHEDAEISAFFSSPMLKKPREDVSSTGEHAYKIKLARNEDESCQFYLTADADRDGLTVTLEPFLYEFGGHTLDARIEIEHYFSYALLADAFSFATQYDAYVPEPLLPSDAPFELTAGRLQGFMITVTADKDAPAGTYKSYVSVKDADGREIKRAAVYAKVWSFTLPDTPHSASSFGLSEYAIYSRDRELYSGDDHVTYTKYYDMLIENNISPTYPPHGVLDERADAYLSDPRLTSFTISESTDPTKDDFRFQKTDEELRAIYEKTMSNPEWAKKGFFYLVDEPYGDLLQLAKSQYEHLVDLFGEDAPLRTIVPLASNTYADKTCESNNIDALEYLSDYLTVLCPQSNAFQRFDEGGLWTARRMYRKYGDAADRWASLKEKCGEGWWYICISPQPPFPNYFSFYQGALNRTVAWQQYLFDVNGILYWSVNSGWGAVKTDGVDEEFDGGDGTLLYFGELFGLGHCPVPSFRLYQIRDSFDDFDYLSMVGEKYGRDAAIKIAKTVTTAMLSYSQDYHDIEAARDSLAKLLEE